MKKLPTGFSRYREDRLQLRFSYDGKRYAVYGKTIKECRDKQAEKIIAIKEKHYKSGKQLSVEEYLLRWLETRERVLKSQTIRTYRKLINRLCNQYIKSLGRRFGDIKLEKLETHNVRELQNELLKCVSTRTANDILSLFKKALTAAVNERIMVFNPAAAVDRVKRTEEPARLNIHRSLNKQEIDAFMNAATDSWYYWLYRFLLFTGMRIGEASALTIADIENGIVNVDKTVVRTEMGYEISKGTKTEASTRSIPLHPEAARALDEQKKINSMLEGIISISNPIFHLPRGGLIRPDRVNDDIKRICMAAGIERFSCHAFRATFTSRCVRDGMKIKELMEVLGHTSVEMTIGLYAHSDDEEKRKQLLAVDF